MGIETLTNRDRDSGVIQQNPQHRHVPQQQRTVAHLTQRMDLAQHLARYSTGSLPQNLGPSPDRFRRQEGISLALPQPWLNYSGGRSEAMEIDRYPIPDAKPRRSSSSILAKKTSELLTPDSGPFRIRRASLAAIDEHSSPSSSDVTPPVTPLVIPKVIENQAIQNQVIQNQVTQNQVIQNQVIQNQVTPNQVVMATDLQAPRPLSLGEPSQFQDPNTASVTVKKGDLEASSMPFIQRSSQTPPTSSFGGDLSAKSTRIGSSGGSSTTHPTLYRLSELAVPAVNSNVATPTKTIGFSQHQGVGYASLRRDGRSQSLSDPDRIQTKRLTTETNPTTQLFKATTIEGLRASSLISTPPQLQRHPIAMSLVQPNSGLLAPHSNSTPLTPSLNHQESIMRIGEGSDTVSPVLDSAIGPSGTPSPHRPTPEINSAILVEQVSRILGRQLAVERERRGLKP